MPHIDELLGAATLVSAGMFAALSLQPMDRGTAQTATTRPHVTVSIAAAATRDAPLVCGPVSTVARRGDDAVGIEREQPLARDCAAKDARQPRA